MVSLLFSQRGEYLSITEGYINDNFSITLTKSGKVIKPRENFSFRDFGITDGNISSNSKPFYIGSNCQNLIEAYRDSRVISYDITIENPETHKIYYGKIAVFTAQNEAITQPVTRSAEISISNNRFNEALGGRTSMIFEQYTVGEKKYPTWIIWISDRPLSRSGELLLLSSKNKNTSDLNSTKLHSGKASVIIGSIFLGVGIPLIVKGISESNNEYYSYDSSTSQITAGIGALFTAVSIPLIISGSIKIAKAKKGRYSNINNKSMELCFRPIYNPFTANTSLGINLRF